MVCDEIVCERLSVTKLYKVVGERVVCVGSPESKGVSRGATAHLPMFPNEAMEDVVEGLMDA